MLKLQQREETVQHTFYCALAIKVSFYYLQLCSSSFCTAPVQYLIAVRPLFSSPSFCCFLWLFFPAFYPFTKLGPFRDCLSFAVCMCRTVTAIGCFVTSGLFFYWFYTGMYSKAMQHCRFFSLHYCASESYNVCLFSVWRQKGI